MILKKPICRKKEKSGSVAATKRQNTKTPRTPSIPEGSSKEDIKAREKIISDFYRRWKVNNPSMKRYNLNLKDYINIRHVSIIETSEKAARTYLSTLAVMQLDLVLTNAVKTAVVTAKQGNNNQKPFNKMILMNCKLEGIGTVKLTMGIRRSDKEKVQYCITVISA